MNIENLPTANLITELRKREFVEAASAAPFGGLMEVLDEHMSAIKLAYPKEYELVMRKITAL